MRRKVSEDLATKHRYYDFRRHWNWRITPHLGDDELNDILVRDFRKFTIGHMGMAFRRSDLPRHFEYHRWWGDYCGPIPRYWMYTKYWACHWLVNFSLKLAMLAEPKHPWRIITSQAHSTVWDGDHALFDFNFQALGITAQECFKAAYKGREMPPGKFLRVGHAESYKVDQAKNKAEIQARLAKSKAAAEEAHGEATT